MRVELDGPLPLWVSTCTDDQLIDQLGPGVFARGRAYADARAVQELAVDDEGQELYATVRGSVPRIYQTVVRTYGAGPQVDWHGQCSCPMQVDCKHVAAVLLTTRGWLARHQAAGTSSWELQLADLVRPQPPAEQLAELGLLCEVVVPTDREGAVRLRLRPVTPGRAGRWIKSGVSWVELEHGYGTVRVRPNQREAVRALLGAVRARQPAYISTYGTVHVHLDDLGPAALTLLAEVDAAGVPLLSGKADQAVELAKGLASPVADVTRTSAGVEVTTAVRLDGEPDGLPGAPVLVGSPAHSLFIDAPDRLLIARFDRPLDPATQRLLTAGAVQIPAPDVLRFLGRYYPALRQRVAVQSSDGSVELPEIHPPRLTLALEFAPEHRTTLRWGFGYPLGDETARVPLTGSADVVRDAVAEQALLAGLADLAEGWTAVAGERPMLPEAVLRGIDTARFVDRLLPVLQGLDQLDVEVTGTPMTYHEVVDAPLISVSAHDSALSQADWFDLTVAVSVGGEEVPIYQLIPALANGSEHLMLGSGTWFRLDRPELQTLRRLVEEARDLQDRDGTGLRVTPAQAGLWEELVSLGVVEHQSTRWVQAVSGLLQVEQLPRPEPPAMLQATLRPYQLHGYHWLSLLWDLRLGGILADDMGLGKTVQTLAMACRAREQGGLGGAAGPLLIVAPTSVVTAWAREAAKFCPDLTVVAVTETAARSGVELAERAAGADLVVTSYALLRIDEDAYCDLTWCGLVLDEAQFVKNHQAKTYQVARRLPAPFKLAITGTPLENSLMDLWSMLSITAPGLFPNPQRFTELYRKPIESGESPEQLATLRRRIRPLMLRRTKDQVATDLPPKIEQVLDVTLNPQHRRVYDKHLQRERQRVLGLLEDLKRNRMAIFRSLTLLRQLSLDASLVDDTHAGTIRSSKIDVFVEQLREVVDEGHRVLVFSQFTGFLRLVRERLDAERIGHVYLDGRTRDR
ncbi:MAG: hypothetical protein JWL64_2705, partial [Frankiales bacterium]|nr:hypothetical protein [Frankiales bacterium]